jgi:hypothetical protein
MIIMKNGFILIVLIGLVSCNTKADQKDQATKSSSKELEVQVKSANDGEEFEEVSPDDINQRLTKMGGDWSAKEVMKLFYPYEAESGEGNEIIEISEKVSENGNTIITLIHDNQLDDSVKGEKYIMELTERNNRWTVLSIKRNWKCWEGRGHTDWGTELCH